MNYLHDSIPDGAINISRHEWAHCWVALEAQFEADSMVIEEHQGVTTLCYPMTAASFGEHFERTPRQAAHWLVAIIAAIRAGSFVEIRAGQTGWDPKARDLAHIERWRAAALPYYGADGWVRLYAASFRGLKTWYAYPQVRAVFREVAPAIARQQRLSIQAILALYQGSGASTCPAPYFDEPVLPHRQPAPAPVQAFSTSVRRRVALQAVPSEPVAPSQLHPPANHGLKNPDGSPRPQFTRDEWATAQAVLRSVARRHARS